MSRAVDRRHAYEIIKQDIDGFRRETFDSALKLGCDALKIMGLSEQRAERVGAKFAQHDEESLYKLSELWGDDQSYGAAVRQRMADLDQVLAEDAAKFDEN